MRGSPSTRAECSFPSGSIPAGAGQPIAQRSRSVLDRVHPRWCGAAGREGVIVCGREGPSPLVRGSRTNPARRSLRGGSIPAGAGQPWRHLPAECLPWVHPRWCGAASVIFVPIAPEMGPSPLVRGSRIKSAGLSVQAGSIPAGAGQPTVAGKKPLFKRVHPRWCGAALLFLLRAKSALGPSPLVRGSPLQRPSPIAREGSIPAGAGQPPKPAISVLPCRVHPRWCGAAAESLFVPSRYKGPSPLVRGSPTRVPGSTTRPGSIPAGAGQPEIAPH